MIKQFPTLYEKSSVGSIKEWTIAVLHEDGSDPIIATTFGRVGGTLQTTTDVITEGKNIGHANETTPLQQALLEAEAKWTKKKKKGYVESLEGAENGELDELITGGVEPMLAKTFGTVLNGVLTKDRAHKVVYPAFIQPKLDGMRCIAMVVDSKCTLWTRTRKPIVSMPHVIAAIEAQAAANGFPHIVLDGELYNHEYHDHFEDLMSLIKCDYVKEGHEVVQYHIYDVVDYNKSFEARSAWRSAFLQNSIIGKPLWHVETHVAKNESDVTDFLDECLAAGYEGCIIRNAASLYQNKRTDDLQKLKEFMDGEFKIIAVGEGRGKMAGKAMFKCMAPGGEFDVKLEGSLDRLAEIYENRDAYIGKMLTVRYQGMTAYDKPRFPIGVAIRDYE